MLGHDVSKWSAISCRNEVLRDARADSKRVYSVEALCKLQCVGASEGASYSYLMSARHKYATHRYW